MDTPRVIEITGPVGAGKSTTAAALSELLEEQSVPHLMIDMDYLRWVHPRPIGQRFASGLGHANLASMWTNLCAAEFLEGQRPNLIILADVAETRESAGQYDAVIPGSHCTVVRLCVDIDVLHQRLLQRESESSVEWYLNRAVELQEIMERENVGDVVIAVGDRSPMEVAEEIANQLGLHTS